tara:strand:+ start:210659 stop:211258 length:600 start_codon:yes stop_codon:yes gene_type:complete
MGKDSFISSFLKKAEQELNLPSGAVLDFPNEDDWSFIIKITALIERTINYLVTSDLNDDHVSELIIGQKLRQKLNLAKNRKIIDPKTFEIFKYVSELRNKAAHNFLFTFEEIFKDSDSLNAYKGKFMDVWNNPVQVGDKKVQAKQFIVENPRITIFMDVIGRLSISNLEVETLAIKRDRDKLGEMTELFGAFKATFKKD